MLEASSQIFDVPYSDTFRVEIAYECKRVAVNKSDLAMKCNVYFVKKPMGFIKSALRSMGS